MTTIGNHFEAEALIRARLQVEVPAFKTIYGLAEVTAAQQPPYSPAAFVLWGGDRIDQSQGRVAQSGGQRQRLILQYWTVLVALQGANAQTIRAGTADARNAAGEIYADVIAALDGYDLPHDQLGKLAFSQTQNEPQYDVGAIMLPATFETTYRMIGAPR